MRCRCRFFVPPVVSADTTLAAFTAAASRILSHCILPCGFTEYVHTLPLCMLHCAFGSLVLHSSCLVSFLFSLVLHSSCEEFVLLTLRVTTILHWVAVLICTMSWRVLGSVFVCVWGSVPCHVSAAFTVCGAVGSTRLRVLSAP